MKIISVIESLMITLENNGGGVVARNRFLLRGFGECLPDESKRPLSVCRLLLGLILQCIEVLLGLILGVNNRLFLFNLSYDIAYI